MSLNCPPCFVMLRMLAASFSHLIGISPHGPIVDISARLDTIFSRCLSSYFTQRTRFRSSSTTECLVHHFFLPLY
jgi:hypothetical protein